MKAKNGFTLIELMAVVTIIGILAAIAIANFYNMMNRAKEGSVKANMHTVQLAVEDYAVDTAGLYPAETLINLTQVLSIQGITNPFNTSASAFVGGVAVSPGEVGYNHNSYDNAPYTITGFGANSILLNQAGTTYILTPTGVQ